MSSYGTFTAPDTVRFERVLPGPIERVWKYLVDPEARGTWLARGEMELAVGGRVELTFWNSRLGPREEPAPERFRQYEGYTMRGRIRACEPPRLLSYTWGEASGEDSEVTFELTERGSEVLLVLTHRRLGDRETRVSVASGWHTHLGILASRLSGSAPGPFWSTHARWEAEYERRIARGAPQASAGAAPLTR